MPTTHSDDPARWRAELLSALLRWVLVIGVVVAVPSVVLAARVGETAVVVLDVVAIAVMAVLAVGRAIPYTVRAWSFIAFVFAFGVGLLATVGVVAQVYLLAVPILAVVLLGRGPALIALAANAATLVVAGVVFEINLAESIDASRAGDDVSLAESAVVTLNFLLVNAVLTLSAGHLIGRLERSLAHQQGISATLAAEQASLRDANAELVVEIAERERAEAEVHRLAMVIEQSTAVILIAGLDGRVVYGNRAHRELVDRLGAPDAFDRLDELRIATIHGADGDASRQDVVRLDAAWSGIVAVADERGTEHRFEARVSPLHSPGGDTTHHVAVLRDVTDELRLRERVRRSERLEALATFASGTAHDFNNVIAAIQMVAEVTRDLTDDPEIAGHMDVIVGACNRARDVVRQMMVFGSPTELVREAVELRAVVQQVLPQVRSVVPSTVEVRTELSDDGVVVANPTEVEQILMQLVENAVEALAPDRGDAMGAPSAITIAVVSDVVDDAEVVLEVSDTGRGIAAEVIDRIFDPFFTTKEPGRGSGLGLAGLHGLVSSLGGSVTVESEPDVGSTFRVALPRVSHGSATSGDRSVRARPDDDRPGTILFVDDEVAIRTMAVRYLVKQGHDVAAAVDGLDAVAQFEAAPDHFDLVVTDLAMPRLDGRALIGRLREVRPDVRVVVSSGFGELDEAELSTLRIDGLLSKPYQLAHLAATVRGALAARPSAS